MLTIDGSEGEGGGQIVRSSLALSMLTGTPVRITNVRGRRKRPGLLRQHLTALRAAAEICNAAVSGDELHAGEVSFSPGETTPGNYFFDIGSAGSTTLVLQTVLPALMLASSPSTVTLVGGTHNPMAPPFDFLMKSFLPQLAKMGPRIEGELQQYGFFPAGGGRLVFHIRPVTSLQPLVLMKRGEITCRSINATVVRLPLDIANREVSSIRCKLQWPEKCCHVHEHRNAAGPGNFVTVEIESKNVCEIITSIGQRDKPAKVMAKEAAQQAQAYLATDAPVGEYLTDQLVLPFAIAGSGSFYSTGLSLHATTHIELVQKFLDCRVVTEEKDEGAVVTVV